MIIMELTTDQTKEKLIKVTLEFETYEKTLTGEEAQEWMDTLNNMCTLLSIRNQNPFDKTNFNFKFHKKGLEI